MKSNLLIASTIPSRKSGGGFSELSSEQYINNFFRLRTDNRIGNVRAQQSDWTAEYTRRNHSYSLDDLFNPDLSGLEIEENPEGEWVRESHKKLKVILTATNGLWTVGVDHDTRNKFYDFSISVNTGGVYRFHPEAIEKDITGKYGSLIYQQWRALVMSDLDSLKELVREVRDNLQVVVPSITCCGRSARLCQKVGIPVVKSFAFLFPSSYTV
ncbi:hypothetical protein [Synechococcus sp. KORDI-49]|uniref:hypothetical protein n=1 Tax=Synechococcus sp. KORDI-49 TaxID=585423 RepID=UPI0012EB97A6|nr:hypothetical protein [Synechococcus sp. KORDI-49]